MTNELKGSPEIEDRGANQLPDRDPSIRAVVLTGAHPDRFVSHADVR